MLLASVILTAFLPVIYNEIFDKAIPAKNYDYLMNLFLLMGALFLANTALDSSWSICISRLTSLIMRDLRTRMFQHLQYLSLQYYSRVSTGETISRFSNDLNAVESFLLLGVPRSIYGFLVFILSVALLFYIEWRLALVTLAIFPLIALPTVILGNKTQNTSYVRKENEAAITTHLEEIITLQPVIRAFSLQKFLSDKFSSLQEIFQKNSYRLSILTSLIEIFTVSGINLCIIIVIGAGALLAIKGIVSIGALIAFFTVLLNIVAGITLISTALPDVFQAAGALHHIDDLLKETPQVCDLETYPSIEPLSDQVQFKNVSFGYTENKLSLQKINFSLPKGQSAAFVGPSGSGKSTILNLFLRFYDPNTGEIMWDGMSLKEIGQDDLRSHLSVVFQDTVLFNMSIRENIRLGKLDADDNEIIEAAKAAEIHDFITQLPDGYDTMVGEKGGKLSGGQRQRIAIARAILRKPSILVLDEATAALDVETEESVNTTINSLKKDHSILCVTHRLAAVENFDMIYVMKDGQIVERGRHENLLRNRKLYYQMSQKQKGLTISGETLQITIKPSYLKAIPILSVLDTMILKKLVRYLVPERFPEQQVIFHQGDIGEKIYLIAHGNVAVMVNGSIVAKLGIGDYFGEIALIKHVPRTATVRTVTPCLLLSLNRQNFKRLLSSSPETFKKLKREAESRISEIQDS